MAHHAAAARRAAAGAAVRAGFVGSRPRPTNSSPATAAGTNRGSTNRDEPSPSDGQSAAAPSPFTPIADYAFLSDCHTGALVGARRCDRLAVRAPLRLAERVRQRCSIAQAGFFRFGPFGINHPDGARVRAGNECARDHLEDAGRLGRRARRARRSGRGTTKTTITPHTRPPADDDGEHTLVRTVECIDGRVEMELVCEPRVRLRPRARRRGRSSTATDTPPTRPCAGQMTIRLRIRPRARHRGRARARAAHVSRPATRAFCSLSWAEGLAAPQTLRRRHRRASPTRCGSGGRG